MSAFTEFDSYDRPLIKNQDDLREGDVIMNNYGTVMLITIINGVAHESHLTKGEGGSRAFGPAALPPAGAMRPMVLLVRVREDAPAPGGDLEGFDRYAPAICPPTKDEIAEVIDLIRRP